MNVSAPGVCRAMILSGFVAVMMIPAADAGANNLTRDNMSFPLDARGAGMGQTGNADPENVANVAFNPAIVSMLDGFQLMWGHSKISFALAEIKLDGVLAGGGRHWKLDESITIGGGFAFGYAKERWGFRGFDDPTLEWGAFERGFNITTGVSGAYNGIIRAGIGLSYKQWKWDNGSEQSVFRQILEAGIWDAGIEVAAVVLNRSGYTLAAAAGFAYSNFGGSIEVVNDRDFLPIGGGEAPEYKRFGTHLTFDSPSWSRADGVFDASLPVVSVAVNYDIVDKAYRVPYETARQAVGGEVGILDMLFFRAGRISRKERDTSGPEPTQRSVADTTVGFGIAVPFQRYRLRLDHAQRHFDVSGEYQHLYSAQFEAGF